jgi:hypothetical protein
MSFFAVAACGRPVSAAFGLNARGLGRFSLRGNPKENAFVKAYCTWFASAII